jgi:geranylgeranyl diphosphate synthase type I
MINFISEQKTIIQSTIDAFLNEKKKAFQNINHWSSDVCDRIKEFSQRGKNIRGALVAFTHLIYKNCIAADCYRIAAALELMHSSILIHDDIIDRDSFRRGKPSIHHQYEMLGKNEKVKEPLLFGKKLGLCAGDIGFFIAFELLSQLEAEPEARYKILNLACHEFSSVGFAEMQDIYFSSSDYIPTEKEIMNLYTYKTARYTFALPYILGGVLAGIDEEEIKKLDILGQTLGIMFQIKDDELDLFGNEEIGKPICSDISEEKKTLYYMRLHDIAGIKALNTIRPLFNNRLLTSEQINTIRETIETTGVREYVEQIIGQLEQDAKNQIANLKINGQYQEMLLQLVKYILKRSK